MTNTDTLFINDIPIRYCFLNDKMYFISSDVCKLLEFTDPSRIISYHCKIDVKQIISLDYNNHPHTYSVITIEGFLKLIFNSHSKFSIAIINLLIEYSIKNFIKYQYKKDQLHITFEI